MVILQCWDIHTPISFLNTTSVPISISVYPGSLSFLNLLSFLKGSTVINESNELQNSESGTQMGNKPEQKYIYEAVNQCNKRQASGFVEHISYDSPHKKSV